jgi:Domain of unknown function (DUF4272)
MTAQELRAKVFEELAVLGFRPAGSLPLPDMGVSLRPAEEIAARLMALDALFTWVAFPEENVDSGRIVDYVNRNRLREWLTDDEVEILDLPRGEAHESHVDNIGWRLENMWALAWVLGFEPEPNLDASQVGDDVTGPMFYTFLPGLGRTVADLLAKTTPRNLDEVIAMEYRFYCAHNAVRSAQLGRPTVPEGFHPVVHGGSVHERRHSLSWCIAPGETWDDTDLST